MKILFIGGTGVISSACTELCIEQGHELYILNRGNSNREVPNGCNIIQADIGTDDYDPNSTKEEIINEVLNNSKSGSIIIFHMLDNAKGWEVLPSVIEGLKKQGYSFAKISDYIN